MLEAKIEKLIEESVAAIEEAVHRNHPHLDKSILGRDKLSFMHDEIKKNRNELAQKIKEGRRFRDADRLMPRSDGFGNYSDNVARVYSQLGGKMQLDKLKETNAIHKKAGLINRIKNFPGMNVAKEIKTRPRVISSAKDEKPDYTLK